MFIENTALEISLCNKTNKQAHAMHALQIELLFYEKLCNLLFSFRVSLFLFFLFVGVIEFIIILLLCKQKCDRFVN